MGFDLAALTPIDPERTDFHFSAFTWPRVIQACGYLFPYVERGGRWFHAPEADPLVTDENPYGYRLLGSNDDFEVSEDARLIARCVRNYVALNDHSRAEDSQPDPLRADLLDKFREFAEFAEGSGGFAVG